MIISFTFEQQAVEEAAVQFIDERIAERALEQGENLIWAKLYVDEALAAVANGETLTLDQHRNRVQITLAALKG